MAAICNAKWRQTRHLSRWELHKTWCDKYDVCSVCIRTSGFYGYTFEINKGNRIYEPDDNKKWLSLSGAKRAVMRELELFF